MTTLLPVAKRSELQENHGRTVMVKGRLIALFLVDGQVFAIDDACPHMGASLAEGPVCDGIVRCAWHGWRFRVSDGVWVDNPKTKTGTYPTKVDGDQVFVEIDW